MSEINHQYQPQRWCNSKSEIVSTAHESYRQSFYSHFGNEIVDGLEFDALQNSTKFGHGVD